MTTSVGRRHNFWDDLDQHEKDVLAKLSRQLHFGHGQTLVDRSVPRDAVFVIGRGFAKVVTRVPSGPEVVLAIRGPGDLVGELVGIGGASPERWSSVCAVGQVVAFVVGSDTFTEFLNAYANAAAALQRTLVNKLREADGDRLAMGCMSVGQRLARLLLMLARRYGVSTADGGVSIGLALSQRDLASYISGSPRTVARQLEQWRQRRLIVTGRRTVVIMRPKELEHIAGASAPP